MCNDTSVACIKNDEPWLSHKHYVSYMIMQSNMTMTMCVIKTKWWKLHGNISQNGYGNAMIGRYGGYFEKVYIGFMCDREYHITDLDAPAKFALTLEVRKGNARYRRG